MNSKCEFELEVRVQDEVRQELAGRNSAVVHPASFYIAARFSDGSGSWSAFAEADDPAEAEIATVTPAGELYTDDTELIVEWVKHSMQEVRQRGIGGRIHGRYESSDEVISEQNVSVSDGEAGASFTFEEAGSYTMRVRGEDADGRYLLTLEREELLDHSFVDIEGSAGVIEVDIEDEHVPRLYVALSGARERADEREDFRGFAVFEPELQTDEHGEAVATFECPDSLSTYGITAVVMDDDRFGHSEHEVSVENSLTVRTALPQKLRIRDEAHACVVVNNQTSETLDVHLELGIDGRPAAETADEPRVVQIDPNETIEERFRLTFDEPGTRELTFGVGSEVLNERLHDELKVVPDHTREAFTIAGDLGDTGAQDEGFIFPPAIVSGSGKLVLRFSSLQIDFLRDSFAGWLSIDYDRSLEMLFYRATPYLLFFDTLEQLFDEGNLESAESYAHWLYHRLGRYQSDESEFVAQPDMANQGSSEELHNALGNLLQVGTRSVGFVETYEARFYLNSTVLRSAATLKSYSLHEPDSIVPSRLLTTMRRAVTGSPWTSSMDTYWAPRAIASAYEESDSGEAAAVSARLDNETLFEGDLHAVHEGPGFRAFALHESPLDRFQRGVLYPMRFEAEGGHNVFYSATLAYDLPSETVDSRDEGFSVRRLFEDLDGTDLSFDELESGKTYRFSVTLGSDRDRFGAFLRVPVSSGMEILDASLSTTSTFEKAGGVSGRQ